ncbi:MAG: hypothetical protein KGL16_12280 [Acidobacteriota bacterium]|nr:hypothetical protein [Acidobacteriota bacterium]
MRRVAVSVCAVLVLGLAGVWLAAAGHANGETQLQANKAVTRRDARQLLSLLRLPHAVTRSAARPRVGGTLVGERSASGTFWSGAQAYWTTDAHPQNIISYVEAHRPKGSTMQGWGSGTGPGASSSLEVRFTWSALAARAYNRTLTVSVVSAPGSRSAIVAQSQSYWIVPRPRSERVPAGVRTIAITLRLGSGQFGATDMRRSEYVLRQASRVAALVNDFDRLPIEQPGAVIACALMLSNGPSLSLAFRRASGDTVANATVRVSPGRNGASGSYSCDPITFTIGSRQQTPLTSGTFVKRIARLIGANIS